MKPTSHLKKIILGLILGVTLASIGVVSSLDYVGLSPNSVDVRGLFFPRFAALLENSDPVTTDGTVRNASRLMGDAEALVQHRVTGICPVVRPIRRINHDGTVGCDELIYAWSETGVGVCMPYNGVCGAGYQMQNYACVDDNGTIVSDINCTSNGFSKPVTTSSCTSPTSCGCSGGSQTVNGHTYTVGSIADGSTQSFNSQSVSISNGSCTYTQSFVCSSTRLSPSGGEATSCSCNSGYIQNGAGCVLGTSLPGTVDGVCSSSVAGNCTAGTPINDNGATACATTHTWTCAGIGAGSSASCSINNGACTATAACGTANGRPISNLTNTNTNLCATGNTPQNFVSAATVGQSYTWQCKNSSGNTVSCSAMKEQPCELKEGSHNILCGVKVSLNPSLPKNTVLYAWSRTYNDYIYRAYLCDVNSTLAQRDAWARSHGMYERQGTNLPLGNTSIWDYIIHNEPGNHYFFIYADTPAACPPDRCVIDPGSCIGAGA